MEFIINHQYEVIYSFGALFSACYMLSYLEFSSQLKKAQDKRECEGSSLKNSEAFYEGFESPDLAALVLDHESNINEDKQ